MRLARTITVILSLVLLTGCAGLNRPHTYVYPMAGQSPAPQASGYETCAAWARGQTGYDAAGAAIAGTVSGVVIGATVGAILGAIICAPVKASGSCAALGAAVGGASGGMRGAAANVDMRRLGGFVVISAPGPVPPLPPPPPPPGVAPDPPTMNDDLSL